MEPRIWFIDTCVLDHIVQVPEWSKEGADRDEVLRDLEERTKSGHLFLLPITAVVETGNHIVQVTKGDRRAVAERFAEILGMVINGKSPWALDEVQWDGTFLRAFLDGDGTRMSWIDLAGSRTMGGGDLSILVERQQYCERTGKSTSAVGIWTMDTGLKSYS